MSTSNNKVISFFKSMKFEFMKITWPSKEETKKSVASVFVFIVACAALTSAFDYIFNSIAGIVFKLK